MSKRDEILEVASKTFREYGYQKANLSDIAGQCGMNKTSIYYYFKNKEDLFMSMLKKDIGNLQNKLTSILKEPGRFYDRLYEFLLYRTSSVGLMRKYLDMFSQSVAPKKLRQLAFSVKKSHNVYELDLLSDFLSQNTECSEQDESKSYYIALMLTSVSDKIGVLSHKEKGKYNIKEILKEVLKLLQLNQTEKKEC